MNSPPLTRQLQYVDRSHRETYERGFWHGCLCTVGLFAFVALWIVKGAA